MNNSCICCGSNDYSIKEFKNNYKIKICNQCGYFSVCPKPSIEKLKEFYSDSYFIKEKGSQENKGYNITDRAYIKENEKVALQRLKIINNRINCYSNKRKILDLGCSSGIFLKIASKNNLDSYGIELNLFMAKMASEYTKIDVQENLEYFILNKYKFDCITGWEYFEHLINPKLEVNKIKKLLKPGGLLCISFPNFSCWEAKKLNYNWIHYKPPEHLNYWIQENVTLFLKNNGFRNIVFRLFGFSPVLAWRRKFGGFSNRKTIFWPITSFLNIVLRPKAYTKIVVKPTKFQLNMYEGLEIYSNLNI